MMVCAQQRWWLTLLIMCYFVQSGVVATKNRLRTRRSLIPADLFDARVRGILLHLRNGQPGLPGLDIPDPMPVPDFDSDSGSTKAHMTNVTISGQSVFTIHKLQINLVKMELELCLNLSQLSVRGNYSLNGRVGFFTISGQGGFWMNVIRVYTSGWAKLSVTNSGQLQMSDIDLDLNVQEIQLHFENLLGKGFMGSLGNTLINALSKVIFQSVKPNILEKMEAIVVDNLNEQFAKLPPQPVLLTALSPLDVAIAQSAEQIRSNDLDPFNLANHESSFEKTVFTISFSGSVGLYDGYVIGLSTLHRSGDILASFSNNSLQLSALLGFDSLEGGYIWRAVFMGVEKSGGVHFRIESVQLLVEVTLVNELGASPTIGRLEITDIQQIGIDVDGLSSFDFVLEFITNFITNVFKSQLSAAVDGPIRDLVQENLNQFQLPV